MKTLISLLILLFSFFNLSAQFSGLSYKNHAGLQDLKVLVPLFGDEEFNNHYRELIKNVWKFSNYEFIDYADLEKYLEIEGNTMILPIKKVYDASRADAFYIYLTFVKTGKKLYKYNYGEWYSHILIGQSVDINKIDMYVNALHNVLFIMQKEHYSGSFLSIGKQYNEYYNQNTDKLKNGTLFLNDKLINKSLPDFISENKELKFKVKLIDENNLSSLKGQNPGNYYYLDVFAFGVNQQVTIYNLLTGEIIFCKNLNNIGKPKITEDELKEINKYVD